MKKYKLLSMIVTLAVLMFTSCGDDFLTTESAGRVPSGAENSDAMIWANLISTYNLLLHDDYSDGYNSIFLLSDLRSDDIWKGGESAGDQSNLYDLSIFASSPSNNVTGLWSLYYYAIAKANNCITNALNPAAGTTPELVNRYMAEALVLRAYYYHILWKFWGNIPYFTEALQEPFVAEQYKADKVYEGIMADLAAAEKLNSLPMTTKGNEAGRVNLATLYMLRARVVMYQKDASKYGDCAKDMAAIINSGSFSLFNDFDAMWKDENEFCSESIFESNMLPNGSTWDGRNGYGTNLPAFISPSELKDPAAEFQGGWGFAPVRTESWTNIWEAGDVRREGSILNWVGRGGTYNPRFQDTGMNLKKYAARVGYNPFGTTDLNYCNNMRLFRYAETLLNYAELVGVNGAPAQGSITAQACLDQVRSRAGVSSIPVNLDNIKKERRREFFGEGMRFWDLIRWGDAPSVLTENYTGTTPGGVIWSISRTFTNEKRYLPIPEGEINSTKGTAFPLEQNPGW